MKKLIKGILLPLMVVASGAEAEVDWQFKHTVVSDKIERPWAVATLPDGRLLITEREGNLRIYDQGKLSKPISGLPEVYDSGQGGLLDVIADPEFSSNSTIYLTASIGSRSKNATNLIRAVLKGEKLTDVKVLFKAQPDKSKAYHFAGRLSFLPDNSLVFGVGDGYSEKDDAQVLDSHLGKILRLDRNGNALADNPFVKTKDALPEIYSMGHRNPQGMFYDHKRGILFSHEHGPKGGDEINIIEPGNNYGWPTITYGVDYSGAIISDLTHKEGLEQPLLQWTPSIAPSSMLVYYGKEFPELNGHILSSTLKYQELRLVELGKNLTVEGQQTFLKEKEQRIRDVEIDAQGKLWLVTDNGELWKLSK